MQKDFHFYVTYGLALQAGVAPTIAQKIAWANQFTDELTSPELYGIQTQSSLTGDWWDRQIQLTVLVPFHFLPGKDTKWPWKTEENCARAKRLTAVALKSKDPFRLGIALHAHQDTFSHQGFSGWSEPGNATGKIWMKWIPNVGHAERSTTPDIITEEWKDASQSRQPIKNRERALRAWRATISPLR